MQVAGGAIQRAVGAMRREAELLVVLDSWAGTPYASTQCVKHGGVDCLHYVDAVLQEWLREEKPPLPEWAVDVAFHDDSACDRMIGVMTRRWAPVVRVYHGETAGGDVLIVTTRGGAGGHCAIVDPDGKRAWHASRRGRGVVATSVRALECGSFMIREAFRVIR